MTKLPADLEALMPEPAFQLRWHSVRARYTVSKPNIGDTAVFTADQVREAMQTATERAAKLCEERREMCRERFEASFKMDDMELCAALEANACAAAIRAASMRESGGS